MVGSSGLGWIGPRPSKAGPNAPHVRPAVTGMVCRVHIAPEKGRPTANHRRDAKTPIGPLLPLGGGPGPRWTTARGTRCVETPGVRAWPIAPAMSGRRCENDAPRDVKQLGKQNKCNQEPATDQTFSSAQHAQKLGTTCRRTGAQPSYRHTTSHERAGAAAVGTFTEGQPKCGGPP